MSPVTFSIDRTFESLDSGWKPFPGHYLLYAASGAFVLEVEEAEWHLPPQRAAFVAADIPIRIRTRAQVRCHSVLFAPDTTPRPDFTCRVFAVTALAREMIHYAMRWGADRAPGDPAAERFFQVLADICLELAERPDRFWLPRARSADLRRAIAHTLAALDGPVSAADAARAAGISERTLARRFAAETQLTWRQFVQRARMIRAMELLADQERPVIEVAYAAGFESVSAFSSAFRSFAGEPPSHYRRRL